MEAAYRTWKELRAEGDAAAAQYRQLRWVTEREIAELKSREDLAQRVASEAKERADQAYAAYLAAKAVADKEEADFSADLAATASLATASLARVAAEKADVEAWCARVPLMDQAGSSRTSAVTVRAALAAPWDRAYVAVKEGRCWDCFVKTDHRDGPLSDPVSLPMCKDCYVSWTTER
jgi:hypothetical protein